MSAHTPGPWSVETMRPHTYGMESVNAPTVMHVADCSGAIGIGPHGACLNVDTDQIEANARLIAAAPDLFSCLQDIVTKWGFPNTPEWHHARAVLDKAKGTESAA